MSRNPEVASFLHAPSNTWSYVVSVNDAGRGECRCGE